MMFFCKLGNLEKASMIYIEKKGRKNEEKENVHYDGSAGDGRSHGDRMWN